MTDFVIVCACGVGLAVTAYVIDRVRGVGRG